MFLNNSSGPPGASIRTVYRRSDRYGESFHWLEAGRDHPRSLVLLHGYLAHGFAFRKVIAPLSEHFHVLVPDLPAHGRDRTFRSPRIDPTIDGLIDWFEQFLATAVGDRAYGLVGHSLGALLCFIAGREHERFHPAQRIGLISPGVRIGAPRWTSRIFEMIPSGLARLGVSELGFRLYEPIQWRKTRMTRREAAVYLEPLRERDRLEFMLKLGADLMGEPDRLPGAHRVDVPTWIVTGEKDHLLPVDDVRLLDSVIPDSRLSVLEGVGHCPMEDTPSEFTRLMVEFFGEEEPGGPSDLSQ